jgi:siroheme synthase (precorrin-2 oxidase/ferrochelatase)
MKFPSSPPPPSVLVIGEGSVAQHRAHELRMKGYATWVASDERELRWLLDIAQLRPSYAVVDMASTCTNRVKMIVARARLAALAAVPVILVGADEGDERFFQRVLRILPCDPGSTAIVSALPQSSAA